MSAPVLKVGDEVSAVITNIDRKARNIQLSVKAAMANAASGHMAWWQDMEEQPEMGACCVPSWNNEEKA